MSHQSPQSSLSHYERNIITVLKQRNFVNNVKITDTLQGQIWRSVNKKTKKSLIVKVTSKILHKNSTILINGKEYCVDENIIKEKEILKYLTSLNSLYNIHIIAYYDFFKSNNNYYLCMENGGNSLFNFIDRAHRLLRDNKILLNEWHKLIRIIFLQLIRVIYYIHQHNICHFDISLENILINDIKIEVSNTGTVNEQIKFIYNNNNDINIKLIDFGLAEIMTQNGTTNINQNNIDVSFQSTKFCGKKNYQSPEIRQKISFDARYNDIWCAGICLFMMISGGAPWHVASIQDNAFKYIMSGNLIPILKQWNKLHYFTDDILDLITSIFQYESKRISINEIINHKWLK